MNVNGLEKLMAPLWLMYPHISRYSIGWRMGYGESYLYDFSEWYSSLNSVEQTEYQRMFPTPKGWLGWYEDQYDKDLYDNDILLWNQNGKMKYDLDSLRKDYQEGKEAKYLFFWGHQPSKDGKITKTCLSQWWKSDFTLDITKYCCMEQYMMAYKAKVFNDTKVLKEILKEDDPKQIKSLGRKVRNFSDEAWNKMKYSIILNGNYAKFIQNQELKEFLMQQENQVLIEASPYDRIWGIGMSIEEEEIKNPYKWNGQNLLGFALMEVRNELIRVCKNEKLIDFQELNEKYG